jgi:putative Holliday junction resolvase
MRVLALDYGRARTGLAISDETGTIARPLAVVDRVRTDRGREDLLRHIARSEATRIVVGLPLTLRGEHGAQAQETLDFVRELEARCTIPIETYDERFTTSLTKRRREETRTSKASRHDDAEAAAHLLEGYLRRLAG